MTDHRHDIEKYLKGELTSEERHALERKALFDPFLADALSGAEQLNVQDFSVDVAELQKKIASKKTVSAWMWTARIAAGIVLLAVSTFIVWNLIQPQPEQELALEKEKTSMAPVTTDSVTATDEFSQSPAETEPSSGATSQHQVAARGEVQKNTKQKLPVTAARPAEQTAKPEALADVAVAETKAEEKKAAEIKVTEPVAEVLPSPASSAFAKDDELQKLRATDDAKKKVARSEAAKKEAADKDMSLESKSLASGFASTSKVIKGKVTSTEDGTPIPGVNVLIKGTTIGSVTDELGNYEVLIENPKTVLVFSFIGYQTTEVDLNDRSELDVQMGLDATQLSEVVVVGYGHDFDNERNSEPISNLSLAHPEIGHRAFKQYLEKSVHYPEEAIKNEIEGRVTIQFTIQPNGSLSDFNVLRGIGGGCDEELIRLIKEGPKWAPTLKDDIAVPGKAKVRMKFQLPKKK
jgi:TonB family protein